MRKKIAKLVILVLCAVLVLGVGGLVFWTGGGVKVHGQLSPNDLSEIVNVHRIDCAKRVGPVWYQRVCPAPVRGVVAGVLNPIEGIYPQQNGSVIVVYRRALEPGWGSDGKRRWGLAQEILTKGANGWGFGFGVPGVSGLP